MSFYKDYIKERENFETIEHLHGFATYQIIPSMKTIYLKDIFVTKEMRRNRTCFELADAISEIGIAEGCEKLFGSACTSDPNFTTSLKVLLAYGFSFLRIEGNLLFFSKEL